MSDVLTADEQQYLRSVLAERTMPVPFSGCYIWLGSLMGTPGYAQVYFRRKTQKLSRLVLWLKTGQPLGDLDACHSCDTPSCVNEHHLFPGTKSQNMVDSARKGRNGMQRFPERSSGAKLTEAQVLEVRGSDEPARALAARYGVHMRSIQRVRSVGSWRALKSTASGDSE